MGETSGALHRFKKHGVKHFLRKYVDVTHCVVCQWGFWSREQVLNHIRYRSLACCNNLVMRGLILSLIEAAALDEAEHKFHASQMKLGHTPHIAFFPFVRLEGPLWPSILSDESEFSPHHLLGIGHNCIQCCALL